MVTDDGYNDRIFFPGHHRHDERCQVVNSYHRTYRLTSDDTGRTLVVRFQDGKEGYYFEDEIIRGK